MKSVRLDEDLETRLERAARALAVSQSEFLRDALARRCDEVLGSSLQQRLAPVIGIVNSSIFLPTIFWHRLARSSAPIGLITLLPLPM